jgi:hypothetical protein
MLPVTAFAKRCHDALLSLCRYRWNSGDGDRRREPDGIVACDNILLK